MDPSRSRAEKGYWARRAFALLALITVIIVLVVSGIWVSRMVKPSDLPLSGRLLEGHEIIREETAYGEHLVIAEKEGSILRLKIIEAGNASDASGKASDMSYMIDSIFRDVVAPYPGAISNLIRCTKEFKPTVIEGEEFPTYILYATDRLTYGACSWDIITYRAVLSYRYCENTRSLIQAEYFVPLERFDNRTVEDFMAIRCG